MKDIAAAKEALLNELKTVKWPNSPVNAASFCIELLDELEVSGKADERRKSIIRDLEDLVDNPGWGTLPMRIAEIRWSIEHLDDESDEPGGK